MSVRSLDYGALLSEMKPEVIRGEEQNRYFLDTLEKLTNKKTVSLAERKLIELLTVLIEDFESKAYPIRDSDPIEVINELMEANGLKQKDLVGSIFETASVVSEVLSGKRPLTVEHIRRLGERFGVSPAAFF